MFRINKPVILTALFLMVSIGLIGCGGAATVTNTTKPADNSKPIETAKTTETKPATADKIGVPECDEYIEKYEACLTDKIPEAQRANFKPMLETMRKSWKDAAATPQGKSALATGCKTALDQAKISMASYSCKW